MKGFLEAIFVYNLPNKFGELDTEKVGVYLGNMSRRSKKPFILP